MTPPAGTSVSNGWPPSVTGTEPPWEPSERWQVVHRTYVERLGPEASVIGPPG